MNQLAVVARAGFVDITPSGPVTLGASGLPDTPVSAVSDPLEANILVLGDSGDLVVIVTFDLLYVGHDLRRMLEDRLAHVVPPTHLFLAASHTHRAPMVDSTKPSLGRFASAALETIADQVYEEVRQRLSGDGLLATVDVSYGSHSAGVNRRLRRRASVGRRGLRFNPVLMAPNPRGLNDSTVRRMRFMSEDKNVVAELWSTALHPTAFPFQDRMSADFPGYVRSAIRSDAGAGVPVLFFQGFSGDVRPLTPVNGLGLRRFLQGRRFAGFSPDEYDEWVGQLVCDVLNASWEAVTGEGVASVRLPVDRASFVMGGPPPDKGWLHALRLGDMTILGVPGEVVTEYSSSLIPVSPITDIWGVSCVDHVWGYMPTHEMLNEGGYEAHGFCQLFEVDSVNPRVESALRTSLTTLISRIADS